jgi:hypothetical protein
VSLAGEAKKEVEVRVGVTSSNVLRIRTVPCVRCSDRAEARFLG